MIKFKLMKHLFLSVGLLCLMAAPISVSAQSQSTKDLRKERKELVKASKAELNAKATKAAQKEAKKLKKEGWQTAPGALPLEKQLDKSYLMQMEYDPSMYPKYLMGEAMSIGENYDGAKMQAMELAKQNLAAQVQTEVSALVDNSVATQQLALEEAVTVTKSIMASKSLIMQSIGRTITVVECFRTLKNKNKEVLVRIAYNGEMAKAAAKQAIRKGLENESEELHKKLDNVLGTK